MTTGNLFMDFLDSHILTFQKLCDSLTIPILIYKVIVYNSDADNYNCIRGTTGLF